MIQSIHRPGRTAGARRLPLEQAASWLCVALCAMPLAIGQTQTLARDGARHATVVVDTQPSAGRLGDTTRLSLDAGREAVFLDFQSFLSAIPAGRQVASARIELSLLERARGEWRAQILACPLDDPLGLGAFHTTQVTWNQRATGVPWLVPGGEGNPALAGSLILEPLATAGRWTGHQRISIDVTAMVREALVARAFRGVRLEAPIGGRLVFAGQGIATTSQRPRLLIEHEAITRPATVTNRPPRAIAGPDIRLAVGQSMAVSGLASFDPDGDRVRHEWRDPAGALGVSATRWHSPTLTPTRPGRFRLFLDVRDHYLTATDELWVEVLDPAHYNAPPIANAGPDRTATEGARVTIGGNCRDPEGRPLTFIWTQIMGPAPGGVGRMNSQWMNVDTPNIPSTSGGVSLVYRIEVSDGVHRSFDSVVVRVQPAPNQPPIARLAPIGQPTLPGGALGVLNAIQSYDPDPFTQETVLWRQVAGPTVTIEDAGAKVAWFRAPRLSQSAVLEFEFTIRDGEATASGRQRFTIEPTTQEFSGSAQSLRPYRTQLTEREARHLLRRAGFGGSTSDAVRIRTLGLSQTVNTWLNPIPTPVQDAELANYLGQVAPGETFLRPVSGDLGRYWLGHILRAPFENLLKERMTFFLTDRYVASVEVTNGVRRNHFGLKHFEFLRNDPFPRYPDFLLALSRDELMLEYLDGFANVRGAPNENYAREFWELFTLGPIDPLTGLPNYSEDDVREAARAFTGWTRYDPAEHPGRQEFARFEPSRHDAGPKTIFGRTANYDDAGIVALTLTKPQAAEWICRNLFLHFVHDQPSPALVRELAGVLRANDWQIESVLRVILNSEAMFSATARRSQVTNPFEYASQIVRAYGLEVDLRRLWRGLDRLDLKLLAPAEVSGHPEGTYWLTEAALALRSVLAHELLASSTELRGFNDAKLRGLVGSAGWEVPHDLIAGALRGLDLEIDDPALIRGLVQYASTRVNRDGTRVPEPFGRDPRQLPIKIRGIVLLLVTSVPAFQLD